VSYIRAPEVLLFLADVPSFGGLPGVQTYKKILNVAHISVISGEELYALNVGDNLITLYTREPSLTYEITLLDN
jgi:hypothetical protein